MLITGSPIFVADRVFDLVVFDFDGTLVETALNKRRAFFDVFQTQYHPVVTSVLFDDPDGSRYDVIPRMLSLSGMSDVDPHIYIRDYGNRVKELNQSAPEIEGAAAGLLWSHERGPSYIFSVTPHAELEQAVTDRGWMNLVEAVYGFPTAKPTILAELIQRHNAEPKSTLVVGDGVSDADAARANGARYLQANAGWPARLIRGDYDV